MNISVPFSRKCSIRTKAQTKAGFIRAFDKVYHRVAMISAREQLEKDLDKLFKGRDKELGLISDILDSNNIPTIYDEMTIEDVKYLRSILGL